MQQFLSLSLITLFVFSINNNHASANADCRSAAVAARKEASPQTVNRDDEKVTRPRRLRKAASKSNIKSLAKPDDLHDSDCSDFSDQE